MLRVILWLVILYLVTIESIEGVCVGQIEVDDRQDDFPTYIMSATYDATGGTFVSGSTVGVKWNNRAYFTRECQDGFDPTIFKPFYLLNKTLSFTADVSKIGCGCDAALYLVAMPAYTREGYPDPTRCGDYYCDANNVCGVRCPEMDIMEANHAALAITPHRCDTPHGRYYNSCDGGGCGINLRSRGVNTFGYDSFFKIDTVYPFNVSVQFHAITTTRHGTAKTALTKIVTTISQHTPQSQEDQYQTPSPYTRRTQRMQDTQYYADYYTDYYTPTQQQQHQHHMQSLTVIHDDSSCGRGYLESMTEAFVRGMVMTVSYWSDAKPSDMAWLDAPPCDITQHCNLNGVVTFSNLSVRDLSVYKQ